MSVACFRAAQCYYNCRVIDHGNCPEQGHCAAEFDAFLRLPFLRHYYSHQRFSRRAIYFPLSPLPIGEEQGGGRIASQHPPWIDSVNLPQSPKQPSCDIHIDSHVGSRHTCQIKAENVIHQA